MSSVPLIRVRYYKTRRSWKCPGPSVSLYKDLATRENLLCEAEERTTNAKSDLNTMGIRKCKRSKMDQFLDKYVNGVTLIMTMWVRL